MTERLACPKCGNSDFEQIHLVKFDFDGDAEDEAQGACYCKSCGWELIDEHGRPITESEEIVEKFEMAAKTVVYAPSISSSELYPVYFNSDWDELTDGEHIAWCKLADGYVAESLEEEFGLPVEFGDEHQLSERRAADPMLNPVVIGEDEEWYDNYNELYCDAANTAYAQVIEARQKSKIDA